MPQFHRASTGDTIDVPPELTDKYDAAPEWERGDGSKKSGSKSAEKKEQS